MAIPILAIICSFGTVFGIFYLFISTRNKERLALIEKGRDASIFSSKKNKGHVWHILLLNLALLLISVGIGIFIGALLTEIGLVEEVAYPGTIFFMTGTGLFAGFFIAKKLDQNTPEKE